MMETLLTGIHERVLTLTLNRPQRLNAWTWQMGAELRAAIVDANTRDDIDAIIITGAGRGFCAGADIEAVFQAQAKQGDSGEPPARADAATSDWVRLIRASKPVIAAVNGVAIGVGLSQLMAMDRIIAADTAKFSFRFVKMGVTPELASSFFLTQRVGFGAASDLMLSGRTIDARAAFELRLVDELVPAATLLEAAHAAARAMGDNPHAAVRATKALLTSNIADDSLARIQAREMAALERSYRTPEHLEAIAAFLEKREPDFGAARARQSNPDS